jgi:hypothetical protein
MSNPNNPVNGLPSTQMEVQNWTDAQARSRVNSQNADRAVFNFNQAHRQSVFNPDTGQFSFITVYPPGTGSLTGGSFFSNGNPPNEGNQQYPDPWWDTGPVSPP